VRIGPTSFACAHVAAPGEAVKVYLRPEDVLARPIAAGDSNVFDASIDKIEFLGSYCLVRVTSAALGEHALTVYLSLNFLAENRLAVGGRLPLRLLPERMRLFA
jgi:iron(III) transport system ATP-binding protein